MSKPVKILPPGEERADLMFDYGGQFNYEFGSRKAGTLMNNALEADFYHKCRDEEIEFHESGARALKALMRKRKIQLDDIR